ncbi:hypothetical protein C8Q80DRAFT_853190 [Daedaleopsis nitida]|nr:hypothetical protein C8Q80DRAFT_853190 [Daedaleopsis nitida]
MVQTARKSDHNSTNRVAVPRSYIRPCCLGAGWCCACTRRGMASVTSVRALALMRFLVFHKCAFRGSPHQNPASEWINRRRAAGPRLHKSLARSGDDSSLLPCMTAAHRACCARPFSILVLISCLSLNVDQGSVQRSSPRPGSIPHSPIFSWNSLGQLGTTRQHLRANRTHSHYRVRSSASPSQAREINTSLILELPPSLDPNCSTGSRRSLTSYETLRDGIPTLIPRVTVLSKRNDL